MGGSSGPNVVKDGLVFAYDMGDDEIGRSWKGQPTTNVITNYNLDTGWSKSYNTGIQWNDYAPPAGIDSQVVSFIDSDGNGSGYWYSYGDYAPQADGTTYYMSVYARTVGKDWTVRPYTANNSEGGRIWLNTLTVPGDGEWHRLEFNAYTTVNPNPQDSMSLNFPYIPPGQRCWLCAPQLTTGGHYPYVAGTRSTSQALVDWTGRSGRTITLQNMEYPGNNNFRFNSGSPSYLDFGSDWTIKTSGGWTVESWVKYDAVPGGYDNVNSPGNFIGSDSISYNSWYWSVLNSKLALWNISPGTWRYGSTTLQANTWYQAVIASEDNGTSYQFYLNGVPEGGDHTSYSWNSSYSGLKVRYMGRGNSSNTRRIDGDLPITRIYDRRLTASEIKQNFNASRSRYGL